MALTSNRDLIDLFLKQASDASRIAHAIAQKEIVDQLNTPGLTIVSLIKHRARQLGIDDLQNRPATVTGFNENWGLF